VSWVTSEIRKISPKSGSILRASSMVWNLFYSCRIDGLDTGASIKPFDDDSGLNDEEQISLWPAFANVPADSRVTYRGADCA
jgi:hypothetical protein